MDQARARVSALQLARLEESSRRMATSLRRVEPKENQDPENHLIPGDWSTSRFREKTELHIVPPHPRRQIKPTTPMPIFLWDKLLADVSRILLDSPWSPPGSKLEPRHTSRQMDPQTGMVTDAPVNSNHASPVPGVELSLSKPPPAVPVMWWSAKT